MKLCLKQPMEVGNVVVAHTAGNVLNVTGGAFEQKGGAGKPLFLQQLRVGVAGQFFDLSAEKGNIKMQLVGQCFQ